MCLKKEIKSPRSPWRQMLRQTIKPRLSRKVIKSARVNLNTYWNKFEELASSKAPLIEFAIIDNEINDNIHNEWKDFK
ncbi:hypothetical protein FQR65_LT01872 [Abscondita terminalis]|nr:hypothetical protein FQR65_LT01872 [Abscondita terminalis]